MSTPVASGRQHLLLIVASALLCTYFSDEASAVDKPSVIWECGQSTPNSAYWKKYSSELEAMLPFDGVMLGIHHPVVEDSAMAMAGHLASDIFGKDAITGEMVAATIENIQAAKLTKLKQNLVYVGLRATGSPMNYFDDGWWETINGSITAVAKAAKDMNCVGLFVDPEQYGSDSCFAYAQLTAQENKPYKEYVTKVRERGRAFGTALSSAFADAKLLMRYGHSRPVAHLKESMVKDEAGSLEELGDLYPAFLDGMLEGTGDNTVFIDGMSLAYGYTTAEEFKEGRWLVLQEPLTITAVPDAFRKKVRCGFGLWTDYTQNTFWWHPFEPERNLYSPGRLQRAIHLALTYSDGYVWLWNEKANWYVDGPKGRPHRPVKPLANTYGLTPAYRDAVRQAKQWPGLDTTLPTSYTLADAQTLGFIDGDELETLLKETEKVVDLPNGQWYFKPDHDLVGAKEQWYTSKTPLEHWEPDFFIGEFWETPKNHKFADIDGVGWYQREIAFDDIPRNARLYLHFGAVDDSLHLWIDGKYVGAYSRGPHSGWNKPFAIEVTGSITRGTHMLVIRVHDAFAMGGIWKGVSLIAQEP